MMTAGVYGLVAGIVKLDDAGLRLQATAGARNAARLARGLGGVLVGAAPRLMKGLSVAGTAAMFLVGGGILVHGVPGTHEPVHHLAQAAGPVVGRLVPPALNGIAGLVAGLAALAVMSVGRRLFKRRPA